MSETSNIYYLAFKEGFLQFSLMAGEQRELINISGFTRDIRKATPAIGKQQAAGVMKFVLKERESDAQYCCILMPEVI